MATIEQAVGRRLVRPDGRAEGAARARARVRGQGDPAEGGRARRAHAHPADVIAKAHERRPDEPARARRSTAGSGLGAFDGMLVGEELNWGCYRHRHVDRRERPRRRAGDHRRHRRAEGALAAAAPRGADPLLVRALRARRRLRRRAHEDDGRAARRRVRPQRLEDVHHERRLRGLDGRLREDRRCRRATAACPRSSSRWTRRA